MVLLTIFEDEFDSEILSKKHSKSLKTDIKRNLRACANINNEQVILCFDHDNADKCFMANDGLEPFVEQTPSHYKHRETKIAASKGFFFQEYFFTYSVQSVLCTFWP